MSNRRKRDRAFVLFSAGYRIYEVARKLDIPYSEAQNLRIIFLKSEELSAEEQNEITAIYREYFVEQRRQLVDNVTKDLSRISQMFSLILTFILINRPEAQKVIVLFPDFRKIGVWER